MIREIPADDYHADKVAETPTLSASVAKLLCSRSPLHAWTAHPKLNPDFKPVHAEKFDVGQAAHQVLLEGEAIVSVIEAPDWRTNAAKDARDAARAAGLVPLLEAQWAETQAMAAAAQEQLEALDVAPAPFTDGKPEQTIVWEEAGGVICRARLDWLRDDYTVIDDLKTTSRSANPDDFTRSIFSMGYDVQVAAYRRAVATATGDYPDDPAVDFRFVVVETTPPYALSVIGLGPAALMIAEKKWAHAVRTWKRCLERDEWPGYPTRVAYAELPAWEEARWLERELTEAA
jgi:hypothetical protein